LASLCLFILGSSFQASADTITFDDVPSGTIISDMYLSEHGFILDGYGLYPKQRNDYNAYAYSDEHAVSENNVLSVFVPGGATYLQMGYNYAVIRFPDAPTGYISVEGVGDPFYVYVCSSYVPAAQIEDWSRYDIYESDVQGHDPYDHPVTGQDVVLFELDLRTLPEDQQIQTILIGSKNIGYTWFDNFTYGAPQAAPLPTSVLLLGLGLISLVALRRKSGHEE
jgi:hypothetical protein